ncbi:hypothetical protein [Paraflavitalea pollutisoli]|uniref:hypothetical protein n=1 Tax=Paraflavitalea pollutisoli TaxID=3034143 RepID=UPI0023ED5BDA|nr:hypothetical protein [Paraflavitalea sp. H1-2-19X]
MRTVVLLIVFVIANRVCQAQPTSEVTKAELSFARTAREQGPKMAFLQYADSQGVVFAGGKPRNALKSWKALPDQSFTLWWHPAFAGIAASGDFGFTTGPFYWRAAAPDTATSFGHYSTVWYKNAAGQWKFLADIGINYATSLYEQQTLQELPGSQLTAAPTVSPRSLVDTIALMPEQDFIDHYRREGILAFGAVTTPATWFNLEGVHPVTKVQDVAAALRRVPAGLHFTPLAAGMAASRDMAYVYGTVTHNNKTENYLRVWGHTPAGWKLLLQVLKW